MTDLQQPSSAEKGTDLERRIAAFFAEHGYIASTNEVFTGRSGGRHEIDVFAQRNDGVTTFRVAIECKAWQAPIDKEVVAKAAYVCGDLGINKVIIVSLHGWHVGAKLAADQQGVELWGPDELQARLGRIPGTAALAGPQRQTALGFPIRFDRAVAEKLIKGESWGFFRRHVEMVEGIQQIWLPVWVLALACSREERRKLRTTLIWNVYESLSGSMITNIAADPQLPEIDIGRSRLTHRVSNKSIAGRIAKATEKSRTVVTASAQSRYAAELESLGVPGDTRNVSVERAIDGYLPVYVGFLTQQGTQRVMAVDGTWGRLWPNLGVALTATAGYLREAIKN